MHKIFKLKKYIDREKRGFRLNLMDFFLKIGENFKDVHFVSMKKNTIRGNHRHPKSKEWILLWEGKFKLAVLEKRRKEIELNVKEPILIFIPENTPHSLKNIDRRELFLISFGSRYPMDVESFKTD